MNASEVNKDNLSSFLFPVAKRTQGARALKRIHSFGVRLGKVILEESPKGSIRDNALTQLRETTKNAMIAARAGDIGA